jgi:hypothetical protein
VILSLFVEGAGEGPLPTQVIISGMTHYVSLILSGKNLNLFNDRIGDFFNL